MALGVGKVDSGILEDTLTPPTTPTPPVPVFTMHCAPAASSSRCFHSAPLSCFLALGDEPRKTLWTSAPAGRCLGESLS